MVEARQLCKESVVVAFENDWREVDQNLRTIARRRAALDADEARWLREAERLQIWRPLGMVSALDYCERVLGYAPHAAMERLRVARALASLPALEAALAGGQLNFSAIRELTRIATRTTENAWRDRALGKNVRQIEELVAGRARGDHPDDPANPDLRRHKITLELSPEVYARWRQTQSALADEHGARLDDDALATAMCERVLAGEHERAGRAKFQILMTVCRSCEQGWQEGAGAKLAVDRAAVERAYCDAQHIGSTEDVVPVRAEQDVPPSVVRFVWRRDGGRCTTPGCRSARGLEIHHIVARADGGGHDPSNLRIQCSACHMAIHRGTLEIVDGEVCRPNEPSHVGSREPSHAAAPDAEPPRSPGGSSLDVATSRVQARDALVGLGWKPSIARVAVDAAIHQLSPSAPLEQVIREALRRCPRPTG
jgi:hypothetical protein